MEVFQWYRPSRSKRAAQQPLADSCGSGVSDRSQTGRQIIFANIYSSAAQELVAGYAYYSVYPSMLPACAIDFD